MMGLKTSSPVASRHPLPLGRGADEKKPTAPSPLRGEGWDEGDGIFFHENKRHSREGGNPYNASASLPLPERINSIIHTLWTPATKKLGQGVTALFIGLMLVQPAYGQDDGIRQLVPFQIERYPLNPNDNSMNVIGKLRYRYGFSISHDYKDFGGISGLLVNGVGTSHGIRTHSITAITDSGRWLFLSLSFLEDTIEVQKAYIIPISKLEFSDTDYKKKHDAEAITNMNGHTLIAFEQQHRIIAYNEREEILLPLPAEISMLRKNGGLETMEALSDGRLLLMAEHPTIKTKQHFGWIGSAPKDDPLDFRYITRLIAPPKGYSPTDATELPNGDVLVLLRRFTPLDGVSAKFWRIKKSMLDSSDTITGEVIATLKPPLTVDNMEGIAVIDISKNGNPIIAVISDDNFNSFQRTLLLVFEVMK